MAAQTGEWFGEPSASNLDYLATVLAAVTGIIHLYEGVEHLGGEPIAIWFVLAGVGFFGGIVLFWAGFNRELLYPVGIIFTAIQLVAYFAINRPDIFSALGIFDKLVQLLLIGCLIAQYRQQI